MTNAGLTLFITNRKGSPFFSLPDSHDLGSSIMQTSLYLSGEIDSSFCRCSLRYVICLSRGVCFYARSLNISCSYFSCLKYSRMTSGYFWEHRNFMSHSLYSPDSCLHKPFHIIDPDTLPFLFDNLAKFDMVSPAAPRTERTVVCHTGHYYIYMRIFLNSHCVQISFLGARNIRK